MAEFKYLQGKCKWAKLVTPDTKFDPLGKWSIQLYLDAKSLDEVMALKTTTPNGVRGILNKVQKDDDGTYIVLSRPAQRAYKGVMRALSPPEVLDKDGKITNVRIGNGSDVTVKVEVYTHGVPGGGKGRAARLMAVRIDNLVPYERDSMNEEQKKQVENLGEHPAPTW